MLGISTNQWKDLDKDMSYTLMCASGSSVRRWHLDGLRKQRLQQLDVYLWFDGCFGALFDDTLVEGVNTSSTESDLIAKMLWVEHPTGSLAQPRHV